MTKKTKRANNDITQKTKERATGTLPKTTGELWCSAIVISSCSICDTGRVTTATINKIMNE
jgi:hypothetical protein